MVRSAAKPTRPAHQIRIIGGQWKRTPIHVAYAEGLRPTSDRVRETVFNWLDFLFDRRWQSIRVLDMFAGSGALGFEAASRGAISVRLFETSRPALARLHELRDRLKAEQVTIEGRDVLQASLAHTTFDLIFIDPPFQRDLLARALPLCEPALAVGGLVYVEAEFGLTPIFHAAESGKTPLPDWLVGWRIVRESAAGQVFYHLLSRSNDLVT